MTLCEIAMSYGNSMFNLLKTIVCDFDSVFYSLT